MDISNHSMDELIIKTIGAVEGLPERISKLENIVREIEKSFAEHKGRGQNVLDTVSKVDTFEGKLEELKSEISKLKKEIGPLTEEYNDKKETKKNIKDYIREIIISFIRYSMLPVTIIILLIVGIDPSLIPWYKENNIETNQNISFNQTFLEILNRVNNNQINESDIKFFINSNISFIKISYNRDLSNIYRELNSISSESIFIWLPRDLEDGFVSFHDKNGNKIYKEIKIVRGK